MRLLFLFLFVSVAAGLKKGKQMQSLKEENSLVFDPVETTYVTDAVTKPSSAVI